MIAGIETITSLLKETSITDVRCSDRLYLRRIYLMQTERLRNQKAPQVLRSEGKYRLIYDNLLGDFLSVQKTRLRKNIDPLTALHKPPCDLH